MTEVEREHVHNVYSQIAPHFSDTRFKPWPRIAQFLREQPLGSLIADVGCGNGKYLGVNPGVVVIGSDICPELVSIAKARGHEVAVLDCLHLPYRSGVFDAAICIAVVHHLSTEERRLSALRELARIVRPRGRMLVYVWAMEQERKKFSSQDVMVPWHLQPKYSDKSPSVPQPKKLNSSKVAAKRKKKEKKRKEKSEKYVKNDPFFAAVKTKEELIDEAEGDIGCMFGDLEDLSAEEGLDVRERRERDGDEHQYQGPEREHSEVRENEQETKQQLLGDGTLAANRESSCSSRDRDTTAAAEKTPESAELTSLGYKTFQRYYHVFCRHELTDLFSRVEGVSVMEEFYDHENWCVLAGRT